MPRGKKFEAGKLGETLEALDGVARKPKESINLKELIKGLKPKIKRLRIWGYNWAEIVELLGQQQIEISEDTLKEYMKTPRKKDKSATKVASLTASPSYENDEQIKTDKSSTGRANSLKEADTDKLNKDNANILNEGALNSLNDVDGELTRDTEAEPESSGYQPIKLTMRK